MSIKISISLEDELAKLVKREAQRTGRTVSELIADAIKAYRKLKRIESYINIMKSKNKPELFEDVQFEVINKLD